MTDRNVGPLDDSQQFDDPSPIDDAVEQREHRPAPEELAVEAAAVGDEETSGDIASDVALTDREAAANDAAEAKRGIERRDVVRWSARALAGIAAGALGLGAVLGAGALPQELRVETASPATHVQPESPLQSRVCAGPALRVGTADGVDSRAVAAIGEPMLAVGSIDGEVEQSSLSVRGVDDVSGGESIVQRDGGTTLSAVQSMTVDVDAARGFAASECSETSLDQWLVGGSTRTGRQSVLTVANASEVSASVDITVYGSDGPVSSVGSTGVAVAPGTQEVLDLAAIAPGVSDAVVHVAATGAPVSAHLQQITTRGLERGGYDIIDPVPALTTAVLPGVRVTEPTGIGANPDYDDTTPVLRLLYPVGGDVRVVFQAADGTTIESGGTLEAGRVTDFPLEEIPVGSHAIRIEADAPVVAGARVVANSGDGLDFDWIAGGQPRSGTAAIAVADGPSATLHIVSTSDEDQDITVGGETLQLAANGTLAHGVSSGATEVTGESIVIGVGYRSSSRVGGFTASPQGPAAQGIEVLH